MIYLKFLHILLMFGTVTLFIGGEVMIWRASLSREVPVIRRLAAVTEKTDMVGVLLFLLGIGAGFATAAAGSMDFTQTWLVLAYILVGGLLVAGATYFGPRAKRVVAAANASSESEMSPELAALLDPRHVGLVLVIDIAVWASIIYLMVVKPFA